MTKFRRAVDFYFKVADFEGSSLIAPYFRSFVGIDFIRSASFFLKHLIALAPQTFDRNSRIHTMTSTACFMTKASRPGRARSCIRECVRAIATHRASNSYARSSIQQMTDRHAYGRNVYDFSKPAVNYIQ